LLINGRPAYVNEIGKKKEFQFDSKMEKHKLFVSNLSLDATSDDLHNLFSKYGVIRDIRIVTYRNGHSKGCAYVEFKDELDAQSGLKADDYLLKGSNIKVAISDPQGAKSKGHTGRQQPEPNRILGAASSFGDAGRRRINAPMVPTSVRRQQLQKPANGTAAGEAGPSLSNENFREMLLK
jgi:RNA recognition motif-containing protein